jgi:hypothetical protein
MAREGSVAPAGAPLLILPVLLLLLVFERSNGFA